MYSVTRYFPAFVDAHPSERSFEYILSLEDLGKVEWLKEWDDWDFENDWRNGYSVIKSKGFVIGVVKQ